MIITKTPIVIPNRLEWLALLAMIGLFGFFAQVGNSSIALVAIDSRNFITGTFDHGSPTRNCWSGNDGCLHSGPSY